MGATASIQCSASSFFGTKNGSLIKELSSCQVVEAKDNRNLIYRLSSGNLAHFMQRTVQNQVFHPFLEKMSSNKSSNKSSNHNAHAHHQYICDVLDFRVESSPFICGGQKDLSLLLETYSHSLLQEIANKIAFNSAYFDESQKNVDLPLKPRQQFGAADILRILKFLIEASEEVKQLTGKYPELNLENILIEKTSGKMKLANTFVFSEESHRTFFCPQKYKGYISSEELCIFSMGMIMLAVILVEDISDCYNFTSLTFCESIFEEKIDRMNEVTDSSNFKAFQSVDNQVLTFKEEVNLLISKMTMINLPKLKISEIKKEYFQLLKVVTTEKSMNDVQRYSFLSRKKEQSRHFIQKSMKPFTIQNQNINQINRYHASTQEFLEDDHSSCSQIKDLIKVLKFHNQEPENRTFREFTKKKCKFLKGGRNKENFGSYEQKLSNQTQTQWMY